MAEPIYISNSQIQSFKDCQRKWYLTYYLGLQRRKPDLVGPLALGTKMHIFLEVVYGDTDDDPIEVLKELYDKDEEKIRASENPDIDNDIKELNKERNLAHAMAEGFLQWRTEEGIDADYELYSIEEVIAYELKPGVFLRGKLDQRLRRKSDGVILFNDWKTTKSFTDRHLLVLNEQMKFYHLLEYLDSKGELATDGALYTMLRKVGRTAAAKPPFYKRETVQHNKTELMNFYKATVRMVENIVEAREMLDAGVDMHYVVPPRPSRDCSWKCPFVHVCPLFDDGSNVELSLQEHFVQVDPDARYNTDEEETDD